MAQNKQIRVLIADDHAMVRFGLTAALKTFADIDLVGEATNGLEALQLCGEAHPDVILMDLSMPEMDGISAIRAVRMAHPEVNVIALTSSKEEETVMNALQAGATSYVLKSVSIDDLVEAIRAAAVGTRTLSPEVTQALISAVTRPAVPNYNLTDREREILSLMVDGLSNMEIAAKMSISRSTVKFHISSIFSKLGVNSRSAAVATALQQSLVS